MTTSFIYLHQINRKKYRIWGQRIWDLELFLELEVGAEYISLLSSYLKLKDNSKK
jgi:hypothetical protein